MIYPYESPKKLLVFLKTLVNQIPILKHSLSPLLQKTTSGPKQKLVSSKPMFLTLMSIRVLMPNLVYTESPANEPGEEQLVQSKKPA